MHALRPLALVAAFALAGCSGGIVGAIVGTRNHQGDVALHSGHYEDAAQAYRLALQLAPENEHARAGLAEVQLVIADRLYRASNFDDALAALDVAAKYDPQSVRLAQLRAEVDDARTKRQIVISNYPTYREAGQQIARSYAQLKDLDEAIVKSLQQFGYTYDSAKLSLAIRQSYDLTEETQHLTNQLIRFRSAVESGAAGRAEPGSTGGGSLLPLP